jgi:hypothetical protein
MAFLWAENYYPNIGLSKWGRTEFNFPLGKACPLPMLDDHTNQTTAKKMIKK